MPIYHLLVHNCQHRKVAGASYWYVGLSNDLKEKELPDLAEAHDQVLAIAKEIKLARKLERFRCPHGDNGCYACRQMEKIIKGEAEFVGENEYRQDVYVIPPTKENQKATEEMSEIL